MKKITKETKLQKNKIFFSYIFLLNNQKNKNE